MNAEDMLDEDNISIPKKFELVKVRKVTHHDMTAKIFNKRVNFMKYLDFLYDDNYNAMLYNKYDKYNLHVCDYKNFKNRS